MASVEDAPHGAPLCVCVPRLRLPPRRFAPLAPAALRAPPSLLFFCFLSFQAPRKRPFARSARCVRRGCACVRGLKRAAARTEAWHSAQRASITCAQPSTKHKQKINKQTLLRSRFESAARVPSPPLSTQAPALCRRCMRLCVCTADSTAALCVVRALPEHFYVETAQRDGERRR